MLLQTEYVSIQGKFNEKAGEFNIFNFNSRLGILNKEDQMQASQQEYNIHICRYIRIYIFFHYI